MNDKHNESAFAGVVLFGVALLFLIKFFKMVMAEISVAFFVASQAAYSFGAMVRAWSEAIAFVALAVAAVYSAYRYMKLVKQGTELAAEIQRRSEDHWVATRELCESHQRRTKEEVEHMSRQVYDLRDQVHTFDDRMTTTIESEKPPSSGQTIDPSSTETTPQVSNTL